VPTAALTGTYTGSSYRRYLAVVTKGGNLTDTPQITVYTTDSTDSSGPYDITSMPASIQIGNYGITLNLSGASVDKLVKNWVWQIDAWPEEEGPDTYTIELTDDLSIPLRTPDDGKLYVKLHLPEIDGVEIPQKAVSAPDYNYGLADTTITVYSGIQLYDSRWTDGGTQIPITLYEASLYCEYRAWLSSLSGALNTVSNTSDLDDIDGALDPDNPIKWALYVALLNSAGTEVCYSVVEDPSDTDSWTTAIGILEGETNINGLVPLTGNSTVLSTLFTHVQNETAAAANRMRVMWITPDIAEEEVIADENNSADSQELLATITDNPNVAGTQYTYVTITSGNGKMSTLGVQEGDILRFDITTDGWGDTTYSEYIIDSVIDENTLLLKENQVSSEQTTPKKIEVWRSTTADSLIDTLTTAANSYSSELVRIVWPEQATYGNYTYNYLGTLLAATRSGVWAHQSLSKYVLSGIDGFSSIVDLTQTQRETLRDSGIWILYKNHKDEIVTLQGVTTDTSELKYKEESIVANRHSINKAIYDQVESYLGTHNVTDATVDIVSITIDQVLDSLTVVYDSYLGGQILSGNINSISKGTTSVDVDLSLVLPAPNNTIFLQETITINTG